MRIKKLHLVGLAAVAMGVTANGAHAEDVSITTATTTPVTTSDPNPTAPVEAGDVTITASGSITVTAGQTAVTVDSDNDVTTTGAINANNANDVTGIFVTGGQTGTINNNGSISIVEDYTRADGDSDGDLDGGFANATSTSRFGIWVDSGGFIGNISSNSITVEGNNSGAIRIDGLLDGNLTSTGSIVVVGDNSYGILIDGGLAGGVDGDVLLSGGFTVNGTNTSGLILNAPIINGGELSINGSWLATGFHSLLPQPTTSTPDPEELQNGGSPVEIHFSVAGGITIEGIGVENDPDDDDDGTDGEADDNNNASIRVFGSSPAVWIAADPVADIVLGNNDAGYGFQNRGVIESQGVNNGFSATGLRIEGLGGSQVIAGTIANYNSITAIAREANAYGVYFGAGADIGTFLNRQTLAGTSVSETATDGYGLYIASGASVPIIDNSGNLRGQVFGELGDATAIIDASGSVTTINNSGSIVAIVVPTDADPTDDEFPVATGAEIAIDVQAAAQGVTITQEAPVAFPDDDLIDNDTEARPDVTIQGDILFGVHNDRINLREGEILGDISFNDGSDFFEIDDGAKFFGRLSDSDSDLSLHVIDGEMNLQGGTVGIIDADFDADATLSVLLSDVPADSTLINASGTVTFAPGSSVLAVVPAGLPVSDTITFLNAASLFGGANVAGVIDGPGTSYLYNLAIVLGNPMAADGAANSLALDFIIKTPDQLGMNANQGIALNPILEALRQNASASAAFAALDNEFDFFDAYEDLMPSFSSAATELATTAIQQMQSATTNRLSATRLHDLNEVSAWAQEIAYGLTRDPSTVQGQDYRGHGFGLAAGIDGPTNGGNLFGLSASFITSETEEPGRPEGEVSASFGQANAYFGTAMGPLDIDLVGGVGAGRMSSRRFVEIGDSFEALSEADWWSFEGHGAVRVSAPMRLTDWMIITPQTALTYVYLNEQGYEEEGGGDAIDYESDSVGSQRLWGDIGVEFSGRMRMGARTTIAPRLYTGWRANLLDEEAERTFRVASTGDEFTLTDEGLGDGGALVGLGVDATNGYSTFTLGYEGEFGDQIERHSLNASIRFRF